MTSKELKKIKDMFWRIGYKYVNTISGYQFELKDNYHTYSNILIKDNYMVVQKYQIDEWNGIIYDVSYTAKEIECINAVFNILNKYNKKEQQKGFGVGV